MYMPASLDPAMDASLVACYAAYLPGGFTRDGERYYRRAGEFATRAAAECALAGVGLGSWVQANTHWQAWVCEQRPFDRASILASAADPADFRRETPEQKRAVDHWRSFSGADDSEIDDLWSQYWDLVHRFRAREVAA